MPPGPCQVIGDYSVFIRNCFATGCFRGSQHHNTNEAKRNRAYPSLQLFILIFLREDHTDEGKGRYNTHIVSWRDGISGRFYQQGGDETNRAAKNRIGQIERNGKTTVSHFRRESLREEG